MLKWSENALQMVKIWTLSKSTFQIGIEKKTEGISTAKRKPFHNCGELPTYQNNHLNKYKEGQKMINPGGFEEVHLQVS